ncbi:MAG TPA: hypothetical protein DIT33_22095 [Pseudomonas sp.]|uniref:glycosyltransferase family 4 protein n=1 Tax=Pseudomonas sp. TaxID=306 RepID=UPI000EE8B71C|nr:glycosyltransferase family 4 protein [Pseudomonas sp.]HCN66071.1 hypothetical protein [Pseudomonas sp.]
MKLLYIQPIFTSYRKQLALDISKSYELTILCGQPKNGSGFKSPELPNIKVVNGHQKELLGGRLLLQHNVIKTIIQEKPDIVLTCANMRDITYWCLLFLCRAKRIPVFSHGQGLYSKRKINFINRVIYRTAVKLSYKYICYAAISKKSLVSAGCPTEKIFTADNSIKFTADASNVTKTGNESGVLFIGRLRNQCGIEELVTAAASARMKNQDLTLHIIGTGELEKNYREHYKEPWIHFYGAIYEDSEILKISSKCRIGCYPGDAGLSVVHYFSLRLPPVVHNDISSHMGPEPSYIKDGVNGITFHKRPDSSGLSEAIEKIWQMPHSEYIKLSNTAFAQYQSLNNPTMESKILRILSSYKAKDN